MKSKPASYKYFSCINKKANFAFYRQANYKYYENHMLKNIDFNVEYKMAII